MNPSLKYGEFIVSPSMENEIQIYSCLVSDRVYGVHSFELLAESETDAMDKISRIKDFEVISAPKLKVY